MARFFSLASCAGVLSLALLKPAAVSADWVYVVYNGQVYAMPQTANGYGPNPGQTYPQTPYYQQPAYYQQRAYYQPVYYSTSRYGNYSQPCAGQYRQYPKGYRGASAITPFGPPMDIEFGNAYGPGYPAQPHTFDAYGPSWDEHDDP